jgi:hypothetical protein
MTLEEIEKAYEAATPGPWAVDPQGLGAVGHVATNDGESVCQTQPRLEWVNDYEMMIDGRNRNAQLIVAAVNNLPKLLEVAKAARGILEAHPSKRSLKAPALRKALEALS